MSKTRTQNQKLLSWLEMGNSITPMYALQRFGIMRLASRIEELRRQGYDIKTEMCNQVKGARVVRFARYRLVQDLVAK